MSRMIRLSMIFVLLAAAVPVFPASADTAITLPTYCKYPVNGPSGEKDLICFPPDSIPWNGNFLIFAHGYVPSSPDIPIDIPWDQLRLSDNSWLFEIPLSQGYAFATTSYHKNGLAIQEGLQDILALSSYIKTNFPETKKILLTGASEGGLITT